MNIFKEVKISSFTGDLFSIIVGLILLLNPKASANFILNIIGIGFLMFGIYKIATYYFLYSGQGNDSIYFMHRYDLQSGLGYLLISVLLIIFKDFFISLLPMVLGLSVTLMSLNKLVTAYRLRKLNYDGSLYILLSLIGIVLGIFIILNPLRLTKLFFRVVGAVLIYNGLSDILAYYYIREKYR